MKKNIDLLNGPVLMSLTRLAIPIMATSLIQMAYNLTDMIWIGRIGSNAVAAVGAAGMFMWLSNGLASLPKMGGQVNAGYSLGAGRSDDAAGYSLSALLLSALFGLAFGLVCAVFASPLIGFFKLNSPSVIADAESYLKITCGLVVFSFLNQTFTGIFTAIGNSRAAFLATTTGLAVNIFLDPVLIFGFGPIPATGVTGAAIATVGAQLIVTLMFLYFAAKDEVIFRKMNIRRKPDMHYSAAIMRIGLPTSVQSMMFTGISMIIARMIAGYGDAAVAVQKVGSQIESISWMTAEGFAAAVNSFIAQNYGAGNRTRIRKGYTCAMGVVFVWGIVCTLLLMLCPGPIFRIFITEAAVLPLGIDYLVILGVSQLFMSAEITTAGAFSGYGKTIPPSVISIVFTVLRIPLALVLCRTPLALNGIWWSITISSILKGVLLLAWFLHFLRKE
ncbi:MAG: MATE family efflux transporter [Dorea sp.]|nr:MATE family efflux transporter [Dorea sp.]